MRDGGTQCILETPTCPANDRQRGVRASGLWSYAAEWASLPRAACRGLLVLVSGLPFGSDLCKPQRAYALFEPRARPNPLIEREKREGIMRGQSRFDDYDLGALTVFVLLGMVFGLALLASI